MSGLTIYLDNSSAKLVEFFLIGITRMWEPHQIFHKPENFDKLKNHFSNIALLLRGFHT